jgi:hypothetical protein
MGTGLKRTAAHKSDPIKKMVKNWLKKLDLK